METTKRQERIDRIVKKFKGGMSMHAIGVEETPTLSRERVRQILLSQGITALNTPRPVLAKKKKWNIDLVCQLEGCTNEFTVDSLEKIRKYCSTLCRVRSYRPAEYRHMSKKEWQTFMRSTKYEKTKNLNKIHTKRRSEFVESVMKKIKK